MQLDDRIKDVCDHYVGLNVYARVSSKYILIPAFFSNLSVGPRIWNHLHTLDTKSKVIRLSCEISPIKPVNKIICR